MQLQLPNGPLKLRIIPLRPLPWDSPLAILRAFIQLGTLHRHGKLPSVGDRTPRMSPSLK